MTEVLVTTIVFPLSTELNVVTCWEADVVAGLDVGDDDDDVDVEEVLVTVLLVSCGVLLNSDVELVVDVVGASENELKEKSVVVSGIEVCDVSCWNDNVVATNELVDVVCGDDLDC